MSSQPNRKSGDAANFIGDIPAHYDMGLGPVIFVDYAADIAPERPLAVRRVSWRRRQAPES